MALKTIMLRHKIDAKEASLAKLHEEGEALKTRADEIEAAIAEVETEEAEKIIDEQIAELEAEQERHAAAVKATQEEIDRLRAELGKIEAQDQREPEDIKKENEEAHEEAREEKTAMSTRKDFFGMTRAEAQEWVERAEIKEFLHEVRSAIKEKRALTVNGGSLARVEIFNVIHAAIERYSKLYKHVLVRSVRGEGRQPVVGQPPEAYWLEACAALPELTLAFGITALNNWKVGGYIPVCNAAIEDTDIDLAYEVMDAIGQGIGLAYDKAIIAGTGEGMPLGIRTRLAQTSGTGSRDPLTWVDYHTTNLVTIAAGTTDLALIKAIVDAAAKADGAYSDGEKFWAMNAATYSAIMSASLNVNATGAVVAGVNREMPVIGGAIEILPFMPTGHIVGGYGRGYLLGERREIELESSREAMFIQQHTVFLGSARADGLPVLPGAFVGIALPGAAQWNVTFPAVTTNSNTSPETH